MKPEDIHLEHHLIKTNASEKVWLDLFKVAPPQTQVWLKGEQPALIALAQSTNIQPKVVKAISEALGKDIRIQPLDGKFPLREMISTHLRTRYRKGNLIAECVAYIAQQLSYEQIQEHLDVVLKNHASSAQMSQSMNLLPWCGKAKEYWAGHVLELPAKLVESDLQVVALAMDRSQWELQADGTNLAYLFMHKEAAWLAWTESGRSGDSLVYMGADGTKLEQGKPMHEWMAENGLLFKGVAKLGKASGKDIAFEQQLRGKSWRSAMARRENWRDWTGSAEKNAIHIVARHHPVSFLTSQARVEANKPLLALVDDNGDDCINHLMVGLMDNIPGKRGSYWNNAIARLSGTLDLVQRQLNKQGNDGRARGIMAALLSSTVSFDRFPPDYRNMLGKQFLDWLTENPKKLWAGMDRQCAQRMLQNFAHVKKCSQFTNDRLAKQMDHPEEFMLGSPEARMILLMMFMSTAKRENTSNPKIMAKIRQCFDETMSEKMDIPSTSLNSLRNIVAVYTDKMNNTKDDTYHLEVISSKIVQMKLMKVAEHNEMDKPALKPQVKM